MKNIFYKAASLLIVLLIFNIQVFAKELKQIEYKNIKENKKIKCSDGIWGNKINKKSDFYLIKKISKNYPYYSEFYSSNGEFVFSAESHYEFIKDGRLYTYSNNDFNFYEIINHENDITKRILSEHEILELFPKYKLIRLTDFSIGTNSLKIKKNKRKLKLIVLNNASAYIETFDFSTNNSKIKRYPLKGFIEVSRKGMIQFAPEELTHDQNIWYVLLIR